tara:strand:+ start:7752 stop:8258 length:507 start_codon:yes stop_codon:yes gene_type:complete
MPDKNIGKMTFQDISSFFSKNVKYIYIIISLIVFTITAILVYYYYVEPKLYKNYTPNKEYVGYSKDGTINGTIDGTADVYFFYTDWCPHCKSAKPIWNQLKEEYKDKLVNQVTMNFIEIDCENDTATADKFKVEGYPTIKLVYKNKIIEYDAKPELNTLNEFLTQSIN